MGLYVDSLDHPLCPNGSYATLKYTKKKKQAFRKTAFIPGLLLPMYSS